MMFLVTGPLAAGETTVSRILQDKGFRRISLSDLLRERLQEQGKEVSRDNLRALGDELREKLGMSALAQLAWERMREEPDADWVVESVYTTEEAEFLRDKGALLLAVTAPEKVRYERSKARDGEFSSIGEFREADANDKELGIGSMMGDADFLLLNDGSLDELDDMVDAVLKSLTSGARN